MQTQPAAFLGHDADGLAVYRIGEIEAMHAIPQPPAYTAIVRDLTGCMFCVRDDANYPQAFIGVRAKRTKGGFVPKVERERLVRKIGCTVVSGAAA